MNKKKWSKIIYKIKDWNIFPKKTSNINYCYKLAQIYHKISYKKYIKKNNYIFSLIKNKNYSILDFGSGNGNFLYYLYNHNNTNNFSLEINKNNINFQKSYLKKIKYFKNLKEIKNNSIDIIYCDSVLQFADDLSMFWNIIKEFIRIAKRKIIILDIKNVKMKKKFIIDKMKRLKLNRKEYEKIYRGVPYIYISKEFLKKKLNKYKNIKFKISNAKSFQYLNKFSFNCIIEKII
jgi:SAM-dependent methyltransferase